MKAPSTPTSVALANLLISQTEKGEAISAPPPKPMIAMPVAMPGRSGNHFISVETGEM
ncbi:hypothetical protein ACVWZW_002044 [Bradyrhizobium sp. F1.13.4]